MTLTILELPSARRRKTKTSKLHKSWSIQQQTSPGKITITFRKVIAKIRIKLQHQNMAAAEYRYLSRLIPEPLALHCLSWLKFKHPKPTDPLALLAQPHPNALAHLTRRIWFFEVQPSILAWVDLVNQSCGFRKCANATHLRQITTTYNLANFYQNPDFFEETCMAGSIPGVSRLLSEGGQIRLNPTRVLICATYSGNLNLVQQLLTYYSLPPESHWNPILHCAISQGQLSIVKWLHQALGLSAVHFRVPDEAVYFNPLSLIPRGGRAISWEYLEDLNLGMESNIGKGHIYLSQTHLAGENWSLLEIASTLGGLPMVRFLVEEVGLGLDDFRKHQNQVLVRLIENRNLVTLRYLHRTVGFTLAYFRIRARDIIAFLTENFDIDILKFLHLEVGFKSIDFKSIFTGSYTTPLDMIQYLHTEVKMEAKYFRHPPYLAHLISDCEVKILRYLVTQVGLSLADFRRIPKFELPAEDPGLNPVPAEDPGLNPVPAEDPGLDPETGVSPLVDLVRCLHSEVGLTLADFRGQCSNLGYMFWHQDSGVVDYLTTVVGLEPEELRPEEEEQEEEEEDSTEDLDPSEIEPESTGEISLWRLYLRQFEATGLT